MPTGSSFVRTAAWSGGIGAPSAAARPSTTPGIMSRCWLASRVRFATARPSRTGCCRERSSGCDAASALLRELRSTVQEVDGISCETRGVLADPFAGIARAAEEETPDLIVIGPHRRQGAARRVRRNDGRTHDPLGDLSRAHGQCATRGVLWARDADDGHVRGRRARGEGLQALGIRAVRGFRFCMSSTRRRSTLS